MAGNTRNLIFVLAGLILAAGCSQQEAKGHLIKSRETKLLMGTVVQLDVCHQPRQESQRDKAYKQVWERLKEIHWRMSVFNDESDVARINHSYQKPVAVGVDTYLLIKTAAHFSKLTGGAFDITVWPLIALWKKGEEENHIPSRERIKEAQKAVGMENIRLLSGESRVTILSPHTRVDLGGIAKGYAVDEAARIFRENGFSQFFIDAGGDIYVGGRSCENKPWRIGIRDPRDPTELIGAIELEDSAITTSGDYEQYYEIEGQKWSHIMNPITGYPQKGVVSATVIAPSATEADALSTALCVLSPHRGISLIDSMGEKYAGLVITPLSGDGIKRSQSRQWPTLFFR